MRRVDAPLAHVGLDQRSEQVRRVDQGFLGGFAVARVQVADTR